MKKYYPPAVTTAEPSALATALPCAACGYDLRGSAAKCPECGLPVAETLRRLTASLVSREKYRRVDRWAFIAVACFAVGIIIFCGFSPPARESDYVMTRGDYRWMGLIGAAFMVAGAVLLVYYFIAAGRAARESR